MSGFFAYLRKMWIRQTFELLGMANRPNGDIGRDGDGVHD